jgi:Sulfatase-modifying factor enzyme 1
MTQIRAARVLGAGVVVEGACISHGLTDIRRGMDLGTLRADLSPASSAAAGASPTGPYRTPQETEGSPSAAALGAVIVRELSPIGRTEPQVRRMFTQATLARQRMGGSPAPRLLHVLGQEGKLLAVVEEHLRGTPLDQVLQALRVSGGEMPVPIALAIGSGLVALWSKAASEGIRLLVDPVNILIEGAGVVRAIPKYTGERARPEVGAALIALSELLAYSDPERIVGAPPDARSAMYVLGLLLYRMIGGAHPFEGEGARAFNLISRIAESEAPPLRSLRSGLHPSLTALVHRCLARDPEARFPSWRDLGRAYAATQALFPPAGAADLAAYAKQLVPSHPVIDPEPVAPSAAELLSLPQSGYHPVSLPATPPDDEPAPDDRPRRAPRADSDAVYLGEDGRPMYRGSDALCIDARPVTRAELERYFLLTGAPRPPHLPPIGAPTDDDASVLVPFDVAEAYARWAGKRLPTEMEWQTAVKAVGADRLGVGEIWEWTSTPHADGGHAIRGGRWRDVPAMPPDPTNRSFETSPAADLGFRCVA